MEGVSGNTRGPTRIVDFKLDSGANVTIIAEVTLNQMKPKPNLKSVYTKLTSPGGQLACLGQFVA